IFTPSALRPKAASPKEVLLRVLGSTKKLTIVLPRSEGTFFISRAPTVLNAAAVSRIVSISSSPNSRIPSKSFRCHAAGFEMLPLEDAAGVITAFLLGQSRVRHPRSEDVLSRVRLWKLADSCRYNRGGSATRDDHDPEERQTGCARGVRMS